jgi:hypothetical protein
MPSHKLDRHQITNCNDRHSVKLICAEGPLTELTGSFEPVRETLMFY